MKNQNSRIDQLPKTILWALYLLVVAVLFKLFNQLSADYDLWWQIFMGKETIVNGWLQKVDIYSFTAFGRPYINHEWLSQIIMAWAYLVDKDTGLIIWRWIGVFLLLFFAWQLIKLHAKHHMGRIVTLLCLGLVLSPGISFRVHLFSYVLLLLLLLLIYVARAKNTLPSVIAVSLLFALWANMHGAFVLGLAVWAVYVMIYALRNRPDFYWHRAFISLLLPVGATLANPFGVKLWTFIYHELSNPLSRKYITEWQPFTFSAREMPFFLVMTVTWSAYFFSKRAKLVDETIILVIASTMGLLSIRHSPLFVILALPSIACHTDGALSRLLKMGSHGNSISGLYTVVSSLFFLGIAIVFVAMGLPDNWQIHAGKDPLPVQTVAFLKQNHLKGNLWVPLHYGGYALSRLYPDIKVSIDGRWAAVYSQQVMADHMIFSFRGTKGKWKKLLEKYGADLAMVEPANPALAEMHQDLDWVWIFREPAAVLLIKKDYLLSLNQPLLKMSQ
jgi:hypothetical protein